LKFCGELADFLSRQGFGEEIGNVFRRWYVLEGNVSTFDLVLNEMVPHINVLCSMVIFVI